MKTITLFFAILAMLTASTQVFCATVKKENDLKDDFFKLCVKKDSTQALLAIKEGKFDTKWRNSDDLSPLGYALLRHNHNPKLIEALIEAGFSPNDALPKGKFSALMLAIIGNKSTEIAEILIKHGSDVNERIAEGKTALHIAAMSERGAEYIKVLCDAGADINAQDVDKRGPVWDAFLSGRDATYIRALKDVGANIDSYDSEGFTMLMRAVNVEEIETLTSAGVNTECTDASGKTPLIRAVFYGAPLELIEAFIKGGCKVNARDNGGRTALYYAHKSGNKATEELLLKSGADSSIKDRDGVSLDDIKSAELTPHSAKDEKSGE